MGQRLGYMGWSADAGVSLPAQVPQPARARFWAPVDLETNFVGRAQPAASEEDARQKEADGWLPVDDPEAHNRQVDASISAQRLGDRTGYLDAANQGVPEPPPRDDRPYGPPAPPARRVATRPPQAVSGDRPANRDGKMFGPPAPVVQQPGVAPEVRDYLSKKYQLQAPETDSALRSAQLRAGLGRLMAASDDAGARLADIIAAGPGGKRPAQGEYDSALKDRYAEAEQPVRDVVEQRRMEKDQAATELERAKAGRELEASDPNSPASRRIQAELAKLPSFKGMDLSGVSASQVPLLMKAVEAEGERENRKAIADQTAQIHRDAMRDSAANRAAGREQALLMFGQRQAERKDEQTEKQAAQFGEKYAAGGTPEAMSALSTVDSIINDPKYKGDLPGVGTLAGLLPDALTSKDGQRLRMAAGQLLAQYQKGITGTGMSESERQNFRRITGLMNSGTEEQFKQGVDLLREAMGARVRALAGAASPEAVQRYAERNPSVRQALSGGAPQRSPQDEAAVAWARANPNDPRAKRILEVNGVQ